MPFLIANLQTSLTRLGSFPQVKISEMLLGPVPDGFTFTPKHKSNSYTTTAPVGAAASSIEEDQEQG